MTNHRAEDIVFICENNHPLAEKTVTFDDLKLENFITTEPDCGYRAILSRQLLNHGHKLNPVMWFDNAEAIKECVKSGMGISYLPKMAVIEDIRASKLKPIYVTEKFDTEIRLQSIIHHLKWSGPALKAFQETIKESFSD
ncbi:substrate-binding domain-containing protein [Emcibacteraceae bacterium Y4]|nr:substrate-binding domain-containing protein [Pseudemcibacter aquimaris]